MGLPSIKTLSERLKLDREKAVLLRKLLEGKEPPENFESVKAWVAQCYHRPKRHALIMKAADEILGTHGVEVIEGSEYVDSYWGQITHEYCNTGDPYVQTLLYEVSTGRYFVGSWGDIAEKMS